MYAPPRSREKLRLPVGCPPRYCAQRAHNAQRRDAHAAPREPRDVAQSRTFPRAIFASLSRARAHGSEHLGRAAAC